MAVAQDELRKDWKKRESFSSAMIQVLVVGALLAGAVYFVYQRGATRKETADRMKEARALALRDNPKDIESALAELEALFKVDADSPDGKALAAALYTEQWLVHRVSGADAKAKEALQVAEAKDSKSEERYGTHALHLVAADKAPEADAYIEGLRQKGASSALLFYVQALAQRQMGNLPTARVAFAKAIDKGWKDPRFSVSFGEALLDEGALPQALDTLNKTISTNPEHLRARLTRSIAQVYRRQQVKDAVDTATELTAIEAELTPALKARLFALRAELANFESKSDEAVGLATQALQLVPDEHYAAFAKARALAAKKDPGAVDAFKAAIALRKTAPMLYFDGAQLLVAAGNMDAAQGLLDAYEAHFKDVKSTTTDGKEVGALDRDDRFWIARGDVLRAAGKNDEALAAYDRAVAAENVNLFRAHLAKGALYLSQKNYDKAAESLQAITPPDGSGQLAEAYLAMGDTLFAKKDFAAGCQNFAFALSKLRSQQAPREQLVAILDDVSKRLNAAGQKPMAKLWMEEAKPIIQ